MNRIIINTKAVERSLYGQRLINTLLIIRKVRNVQVLNMNLSIDKPSSYLLGKRKKSIVEIRDCKNILIANNILRMEPTKDNIYSTVINNRTGKYFNKCSCK